jgi:xanthine dehydrogenase small subunit
LLAGGTDVGLWVTKQHKPLPIIIYLGRVEALCRIEETDTALVIGAGVRYADALPRLAALWPSFGALIERLGAMQVRAVGTIGGNIANASPIGDSLPVLIALGAEILLRGAKTQRRMAVEDYFLGYQKQDRRPGEFVERIIIPRPGRDDYVRCYKISKRIDQDISAVCAGFNLRRSGGVVQEARIAFGGMAATPKRAPACEAMLRGKPWTRETVRAAAAALTQDFAPISDFRASADYRMSVAQNLLVKAFLEDAP